MPNLIKIKIITIIFLINLATLPLTGNAQSATQSANIQITTTPTISLSAPSTLQMPTAFSFPQENNNVYKAFSPDDPENRIRVGDSRNAGGFIVDLTATDFTDGTQIIPYQNIGLVTLSGTNHFLSINYDGLNSPPDDDGGTVYSPLHCPLTSETEIESCENYEQGFITFTGTGPTSAPLLIIDGQSPTTGGRRGSWFVGLGIRLTVPPALGTNSYNSTITLTLTQT